MANHKQPATSRWDEKKEHLSAKTRNGFEQWVKRKVRGTTLVNPVLVDNHPRRTLLNADAAYLMR